MSASTPPLIVVCAASLKTIRRLDPNLAAIRPQVQVGEGIVFIPNYSAKRRDVERAFASLLGRLRNEATLEWKRKFPADGASEAWRLKHGGYLGTRIPRAKVRSYAEVARLLGVDKAQVVRGVQRMDRYLSSKDGHAFKTSPSFEAWKRLGNNAFLA